MLTHKLVLNRGESSRSVVVKRQEQDGDSDTEECSIVEQLVKEDCEERRQLGDEEGTSRDLQVPIMSSRGVSSRAKHQTEKSATLCKSPTLAASPNSLIRKAHRSTSIVNKFST